mgnify:CR=1 FL=1
MKDLITQELLTELGLTLVSLEESKHRADVFYGKAIGKGGMEELTWNTSGAHCTYSGVILPANVDVCLKKDGGTRTAFNGYVFTQDDLRKVIQLTS